MDTRTSFAKPASHAMLMLCGRASHALFALFLTIRLPGLPSQSGEHPGL